MWGTRLFLNECVGLESSLQSETSALPVNRPESAKLPLTAASHCFDERIGDFSTVDTTRCGKVMSRIHEPLVFFRPPN
jgi:hypothetical protein